MKNEPGWSVINLGSDGTACYGSDSRAAAAGQDLPRIGILAGASESFTAPFEPFRLDSRDSSSSAPFLRLNVRYAMVKQCSLALPLPYKIVTFCPSCNRRKRAFGFS